jgi:hypothetical protein
MLITASVVPSSPILVTLMKKALSSSETSVLIRATRRNIPEDAILQMPLEFEENISGDKKNITHSNTPILFQSPYSKKCTD